jgi:hypothetical protein
MLREALHRDPPRKPTRPTRASHERRRRAKEIRSRRKGARKKPDPGAD